MMKTSRWLRLLLLVAAAVVGNHVDADEFANLWQSADAEFASRPAGTREWLQPTVARHYRIEHGVIGKVLTRAPLENSPVVVPIRFKLPRPDGTMAEFRLAEAPVMAPELAAKFPEIKTYVGQGVDDPHATARLGWGPSGFYAQVLTPRGAYYIEPRLVGDNSLHVVYFKRDYSRPADGFTCFTPNRTGPPSAILPRDLLRVGPTLRTYRLAVGATGEYTAFHGGTVTAGMNAIVQAVNRVVGVYETELGIRMVLVANNNLLIFTNAATDPYTNNNGLAMLGQNQTTVDATIGAANYDIGHVFSTGGGGVAGLGVVCVPGQKAQGVTGLPAPIGDAFYIDYVAHEMGHQFGANHTFNSPNGSCAGNINPPTAYEPGSGSTIMAYAGICPPDDLQPNSDPFFHSASFDEILTFITSGGSCSVNTATGNTAPNVSAGANYTIPIGTPFALTATASDPDGDALTYLWDERDLGPSVALTAPDNGRSPLFRSFRAVTSPSRTFPQLSNILSGLPSLGERLPTLARTMNFRVTARDNRAGGGGVNTADMQVIVDATAGPFRVTAPSGGSSVTGPMDMVWNVANTTNATVRATNVNIRLSVDGGLTFPILLASNTPNDGFETVFVPPVSTTQARFKVEGAGNIFFDISHTNVTLVPGSSSEVSVTGSVSGSGIVGTPLLYTLTVSNSGPGIAAGVFVTNVLSSGVAIISASASQGSVDTNGPVVFDVGTLNSGATATLLLTVVPTNIGTLFNVVTAQTLSADSNPNNNSVTLAAAINPAAPTIVIGPATLTAESFLPFNGAIESGETVTVELGLRITSGLATNLLGVLLPGGGVSSPSASQTFGALTALNGVVSRPFTFTAGVAPGTNIIATLRLFDGARDLGNLVYTLPVGGTVVGTGDAIVIRDTNTALPYPSVITLAGVTGVVSHVTVNLNKFNHTFPDDVDVLLVSPGGQKVVLMSDVGGGNSVTNLFLTFDDAATDTLPDATVLVSGTNRPTDFEAGDTFAAPAPTGPYSNVLAAFNGSNPNGTWSLYVVDDTAGDVGTIAGGWSLAVSTLAQLNPPGDLALSMAASAPAVVGLPFSYTLTVSNRGPSTANGVVVTNALPPGLTVVSVTASQGGGTNSGSAVTASLGRLAPGAAATVTIATTPMLAGVVTNTALALASQTETAPVDNVASVVTVVSNPAPILARGSVAILAENVLANGAVDAGETVTVSFGLRNVGTADTANLVATLLNGSGVSSSSGSQNYGALTVGGPEVSRPFMFTAGAPSNGLITAVLQLQDGATSLGTVAFTFNAGATTAVANASAIVIPTNGPASPYPSVIQLAGVAGVVSKVTVTVSNLSHTFPDDIDMLLVGPGGERVLLMSDAGGGVPASGVTLTFADDAGSQLPDGSPLVSGTFQPTDYYGGAGDTDAFAPPAPAGPYGTQLSVFNGTDPNGTWSLFVTDDTGGDQGMIASGWRLNVTAVSPVNPVTDLSLDTVASASQVGVGSNLAFVVTVTNRGPATANSVVITNPIPANAVLLVANASQGSVITAGGQIFAFLGTISNGATATLTFHVNPQIGGLLTNLAGVYASEADLLPGNNVKTTVVDVLASAQAVLGPVLPQGLTVFQFVVNGQTGLQYVIEASDDLISWTPISTNVIAGGKVTINDPDVALHPQRFYRARQQP